SSVLPSHDLGREGHDLHETLVAQLPAHRAEDAGATRVALLVDEHGRVVVEADVAAVGAAALLLGPHHHAADDVALLDAGTGGGLLHGGHEDVADRGVPPAGAAEHLDDEHLLGAAVVGDLEAGFLLDHRYFALSRISATRQRFSFESGRVSMIRTRSPTRTSSFSSCA